MKILLDTNILIDYYAKRHSFYDDARTLIKLCVDGKAEGCIAAHSVVNMFYILRKSFTIDERRMILKDLCKVVSIIGIDKSKIENALDKISMSDFEDCLQSECAKEFEAEYIITRNIDDYNNSDIPAILPVDFLRVLGEN